MINCYNKGNGVTGGLINWDERGKAKIINCYNSGQINGREKELRPYNVAGGIISVSTSSDKTQKSTLINVLSLGKFRNYACNFYYTYTDTVNNLENCFYPASIAAENSKLTINEGSIAIDENNVKEVLDQLNEYVKEHKNDYEVPLKEWKLEVINGEKMPVLAE